MTSPELIVPSRATSMIELGEKQSRMMTKEEVAKGLAFKLRFDDVVISPYAKCGTTWLQQMAHCLRSRGDMKFEDISDVVPWIETSAALGIDLDAEQLAQPRCFKSHLSYQDMIKGGRYIVSIRNPVDAMISSYRFFEGWFFEPGSIEIEEFAIKRFLASKHYWTHLRSWWFERHNPKVLFLVYEKMLGETERTISRVAEFIDIPLDEKLLRLTVKHTSREFMLEYQQQFSDGPMRRLSEARCPLPSGSQSAKISSGSKAELSDDLLQQFDQVWREEMTDLPGINNYAELVAAIDS